MVELYKQATILNSLAVEADNVVVIVGAAWNLMQITEQQATDLAATALEWGRTRNKCVRGVDFVDSSGKVLATYEPVGGVKFVSPATQPASAPTTRE